jgi:glycine/D-amino acid oxidase-like deaminating enzyme
LVLPSNIHIDQPTQQAAMPGVSSERHIAIVGGGIIGASIFYYLSQASPDKKLKLTLIEESSTLAPGASGKSGGFLAEDWHGEDTADLARLSYRLHRELAEKDGGSEKWEYRPVETLSLSFDDSKSKSKCPPEIDWVDGQHVTSTSSMGGSGTTAQVTPLKLVEHLVAESQRNSKNVDVILNTRAERINLGSNGRVESLIIKDQQKGEERSLNVDDVVIAAGPWTGKLLKSLLPSGAETPSFYRSASRITGSRAHSVVMQSPKPTSAHCLFTEMRYGRKAAGPEVYCRKDGTIYACGGSDNVPLPPSADKVSHDSSQTAKLIEQMQHLSPSHFGSKSGAKVTREHACYLPVASGGPVLAGDVNKGLYVAAGHSCWGITLSLGK